MSKEKEPKTEQAASSAVETFVMCSVDGVKMPIRITIDGKEMRFCIWPMSENNWNCGYIADDGSESFANRNEFHKYKTMKDAAMACKKAIIREGYYT